MEGEVRPLDAGRVFAPGERSLGVMLQARAKNLFGKPKLAE